MINKRKVNAVKELFDGRMKIKLGEGYGDIQNRKEKERTNQWRIGLFKSLRFFIRLSFIIFQHFLLMIVDFLRHF